MCGTLTILGPVDTVSTDELLMKRSSKNSNLQSRSKSFSVVSNRIINPSEDFSDDGFMSDSSEAPDFSIPPNEEAGPAEISKMKIIAEPGKDRIIFDKITPSNTCNLIGRDFPSDEHVLSVSDISSVTLNNNLRF